MVACRLHVLFLFVLVAGAWAITLPHKASTLSAKETESDSSCHYNLYLGNYETTGYQGAIVKVYADGEIVSGFEDGATYPTHLNERGFQIPVVAGQVLSVEYIGNGSFNQFWVMDVNGNTVLSVENATDAVHTVGTASCACQYITEASECPEYRVRNEWRTLSYCDQQLYLRALKKMRWERGSDGEFIYDKYIIHHNTFSSILIGKSEFLPWHRAFAFRFENELRTMGGDYTCLVIPYWDWSLDFANESLCPIYDQFGGLREESCLGGDYANWTDPTLGTCVYRRHAGYARGVWAPSTYPLFTPQSGVQLGVTVNSSYVFIFKFLVRNPHKSVHNYIGGALGSMSKLSSPADPLFWLHHNNIDRIWALWQDCWDYDQPGMEEAQYEDLTSERDAGLDNPLVPVWPGTNTTARDVLSIWKLKVSYPPVYEQWPRLHGVDAIYNPTFCKWDWFDAGTQAARGLSYRPHVYTDYQIERMQETIHSYKSYLVGEEEPDYYKATIARLDKECDMGNAWNSDDFAEMFSRQMDPNKKIGPSSLFRNVCKMLGDDTLYQLYSS